MAPVPVRRRSLTGCGTCRKRKIKCDGQKPECQRCLKSHLKCGGYEIQLRFCAPFIVDSKGYMVTAKEANNNTGTKYQRRFIPFMKFTKKDEIYYSFQEMDPDLNDLESIDTATNEIRRGPFRAIKLKLFNKTSNSNTKANKFQLPPIKELSKEIPLPPALLLEQERKKSNNYEKLMATSLANLRNSAQKQKNPDIVTPRSVWIHPRLKIDAILTYQTLHGSCDIITNDWKLVEKTVFSNLFNTQTELKNRIIDKMDLSDLFVESQIKFRANEIIRALSVNGEIIIPVHSFTALLRMQKVQELVRLFVKSQPNIMYLSYSGCLFDTIVIPFLYKIVGELLVFESSVGINNGGDIEFRNYCDIMKRTFCMIALSITSFSQYKLLFSEHGIYEASLGFFKCFIAFREMSLFYLAKLLKPLMRENKFTDILGKLANAGLLKELAIIFILALYQDSYVDIIHNYKVLYGILQQMENHYRSLNTKDEQMDDIWLWYRYLNLFYKTCSTIDLDNYVINDEGFEDLEADYNLIDKFEFDDHFKENEFTKIEIRSMVSTHDESGAKKIQENELNLNNVNDVDQLDDELDDESDDESDDDFGNEDMVSPGNETIEKKAFVLPKRLANRPEINDKPPRSFSISFNYCDDDENDSENLSGEYDTKSTCVEIKYSSNEITDVSKTELLNEQPKHINEENVKNFKVDALTGLTNQAMNMTRDERERVFDVKKKLIKIYSPSQVEFGQSGVSSVELSIGIPISLLELMERTLKLADHRNWCLRNKKFPRNFPKFCCDIEEELMNWKIPWDLYEEGARDKNGELKFHTLFHKTIYHLVITYYNTILLFFSRLIKDLHPSLLQDHIISTIEHLEELRKLSLRAGFLKQMKISPCFWCFFIAGSDAIDISIQRRFDELGRKWFAAGHKWIGKQIMMEIWRGRNQENVDEDDDEKETSWLDMIKGWEISGYN